MDLHNLQPAKGSVKTRKRVGRGAGSGLGGTSTRGNKGAKQRSGYKKKIGFEGGQMPIQRRLPKYGFKNINRVAYKAINLSTIEALGVDKVNLDVLHEAGLISKKQIVKILGNGKLTKAVTVEANAFSKSAEEAITAAGGTVVKIEAADKGASANE
jgi:large subunit ribosomal protein L15